MSTASIGAKTLSQETINDPPSAYRPRLPARICLRHIAGKPIPRPTERHDFVAAALDADMPEHPVEIVETAVPLPLPGQLKPLDPSPAATSLPPAEIIAKGTHAARLEPTADGYLNAIHVYPYTEGALYCLYASPGQVSDIALQPGETLVSVSAGDTVRWVVGDTSSGSGDDTRTHILVKPVASGLTTNLMIATDRRTYHLELTSLETSYMAALSWRYPADELAILTSRNQIARSRQAESISPNLNLSDLNFDYRIEGDRPDWRPVRVFDDGRRVFIQMPADLANDRGSAALCSRQERECRTYQLSHPRLLLYCRSSLPGSRTQTWHSAADRRTPAQRQGASWFCRFVR
jgi:P-type conjugative transfer protein TrbG